MHTAIICSQIQSADLTCVRSRSFPSFGSSCVSSTGQLSPRPWSSGWPSTTKAKVLRATACDAGVVLPHYAVYCATVPNALISASLITHNTLQSSHLAQALTMHCLHVAQLYRQLLCETTAPQSALHTLKQFSYCA